MDLVERYIAAVQRELPEGKQQEIGRELNANIRDQLDALKADGGTTDDDVMQVLTRMGHPRTVAQQFVPSQPLISASYMPLYLHSLVLVLGLLFLLQIAESTIAWLSSAELAPAHFLKSLLRGFIENATFGFTAVTLVCWAISHHDPEQIRNSLNDWHPQQLPTAAYAWQHISLQDVFTELVTYTTLLLLIWYPVWTAQEQLAGSSLIISERAHQILQWASPLAILGILLSLWQLRQRLWSRRMLISNIALNIAIIAVILLIARGGPLLQTDIAQWRDIFAPEQLERSALITLVVIAMFPLWEIGRDLLRLRRT